MEAGKQAEKKSDWKWKLQADKSNLVNVRLLIKSLKARINLHLER